MAYKPEPLLRNQLGKKLCVSRPGGTKLCIEGKKYGFSAQLIGKSGAAPGLPVPTQDPRTAEPARTLKQALANAERFLARVHGKNN